MGAARLNTAGTQQMMPFPKTIAEQITLLGGKVLKIEHRGKHVRIHYMFGACPVLLLYPVPSHLQTTALVLIF